MPGTRYLVIWCPLFEEGQSRQEAVSLIQIGWRMKAPWLIDRRRIELKTTNDLYVLQECSAWMEKHWGRHLKHNIKALSVIAITDPLWQTEEGEELFRQTVKTMEAGHNYQAQMERAKPQQFFLGVERETL